MTNTNIKFNYTTTTTAAALYDGGWRSTDLDEIIKEYDLSTEEADAITKELERLESLNK